MVRGGFSGEMWSEWGVWDRSEYRGIKLWNESPVNERNIYIYIYIYIYFFFLSGSIRRSDTHLATS